MNSEYVPSSSLTPAITLKFKETLFFKKNGLFGKDCTVISQSINTRAAVINNLIEFEDGRRFIVDGKISIDAAKPNRVNFQFSGACITIPPLNIPLPPVGKVSNQS